MVIVNYDNDQKARSNGCYQARRRQLVNTMSRRTSDKDNKITGVVGNWSCKHGHRMNRGMLVTDD